MFLEGRLRQMRYVIKHVGENHTMISSNVPCALLRWEMFL